MVRKAAGEYSKTKEEQLGQAVKAAFDWFSTCYGAITKYLCRKESIEHIVVNSKCHSYGTYSLSRINALHSSLDRFLGSNEYKPATKYLDLYLIMFWWIEKNKDVSQIILCEQLFNILLGRVSYTVRSKMINVRQSDLISRPLPIDGMGYY